MLASFKSVRHKWLAFTALALAMAAVNWPEQKDNQAASVLPTPTVSPTTIAIPALPAVPPVISSEQQEAEEQEAIDAAFDGGGIPQSEVLRVAGANVPGPTHISEQEKMPTVNLSGPIYSSEQEKMLDYANYYRDKQKIVNCDPSPELMDAAQKHAEFLAGLGYGSYVDRYGRTINLPSGHSEWGDGNAHSRAAQHGFSGSISCDDPTSSVPGHRVTGEIIYCGKVPIEKAFADWSVHDSGHWIPLTSSEFNVAGFGYAENASGQGIFVGMYGDTRRKAADEPPILYGAPARSSPIQQAGHYESYGILGRRQRWVSGQSAYQQSHQQPVYQSYGSCAGGSCGRR